MKHFILTCFLALFCCYETNASGAGAPAPINPREDQLLQVLTRSAPNGITVEISDGKVICTEGDDYEGGTQYNGPSFTDIRNVVYPTTVPDIHTFLIDEEINGLEALIAAVGIDLTEFRALDLRCDAITNGDGFIDFNTISPLNRGIYTGVLGFIREKSPFFVWAESYIPDFLVTDPRNIRINTRMLNSFLMRKHIEDADADTKASRRTVFSVENMLQNIVAATYGNIAIMQGPDDQLYYSVVSMDSIGLPPRIRFVLPTDISGSMQCNGGIRALNTGLPKILQALRAAAAAYTEQGGITVEHYLLDDCLDLCRTYQFPADAAAATIVSARGGTNLTQIKRLLNTRDRTEFVILAMMTDGKDESGADLGAFFRDLEEMVADSPNIATPYAYFVERGTSPFCTMFNAAFNTKATQPSSVSDWVRIMVEEIPDLVVPTVNLRILVEDRPVVIARVPQRAGLYNTGEAARPAELRLGDHSPVFLTEVPDVSLFGRAAAPVDATTSSSSVIAAAEALDPLAAILASTGIDETALLEILQARAAAQHTDVGDVSMEEDDTGQFDDAEDDGHELGDGKADE